MKNSISVRTLLPVLVSCVAALHGSTLVASAQPAAARRQAEIHLFSGRPNLGFTLTEAEDAELRRQIRQVPDAPAPVDPPPPETLLRPKLGYRGVSIRVYAEDGSLFSNTEVAGRDILVQVTGRPPRRRRAASNDIERWLVDLAVAKGVIDGQLHGHIEQEMQRSAGESGHTP